MKCFVASFFLLFFFQHIIAQQSLRDTGIQKNSLDTFSNKEPVVIGDIIIIGNKKTKNNIILREMTFKKGDIINTADLNKQLEESRQLIYNTALFVDDSVYVSNKINNIVFITIHVKERWYFFPIPYFVLADRNFNEWLVQEKASLDRVDYGIILSHNNLTGKNDRLSVSLINGYDQQVSLRYQLPFANKSLTKGFSVGFLYARQHEVNYGTDLNNDQLFLKLDNTYAREFRRFDITYSYRPNQHFRHYIRFSYNDESIADTVVKLNQNYFPNQRNNVQYPDFTYTFQYYHADYYAYPTKGFIGQASLYKRGLNEVSNLWQISLRGIYSIPISSSSFIRLEGATTIKFPNNPYFFSQALFGYGYMQMRGLEYYVIDGMAGALGKFTYAHQLFHLIVKNPVKSVTHDRIPFRFYAKVYSDLGYAYNPYVNNNLLNNTLMRTWGLGIDIVSIYDFVFRLEYSFNQLGNNGIYLHAN
jgi:outer membrane protein assembly factor BamA